MEITKSVDESSKRVKHRKRSKESSSDSDSYLSSLDQETKQKLLKKLKKFKKKEKKKKKKKERKRKEKEGERRQKKPPQKGSNAKETVHAEKNIGPRCSRNFVPMTKEEWERQQNTLRRVYDEETGRMRFVSMGMHQRCVQIYLITFGLFSD